MEQTLSQKRDWMADVIRYLPGEAIEVLYDQYAGTPEKREATLKFVADQISEKWGKR